MSPSNIYSNQQQLSQSHGFASSSWYQAMTLHERIASGKKNNYNCEQENFDRNLANRRLQRWRSEYPFTSNDYFEQRLALENITEEEFQYLLGESADNLGDRLKETPDWLTELAQVFTVGNLNESEEALPFPQQLPSGEVTEFLTIIAPIINRGRQKLRQGIKQLAKTQSSVPFEAIAMEELFLQQLPDKLLRMVSKTLVLELNVARLQGILKGDTPEERFDSFLAYFCQPEQRLAFLQEYPVLARKLILCINQWVNFSLEFLHNLCVDLPQIEKQFYQEKSVGILVDVKGNIGDSHHEGRAVLSAKFSSGFQIVYKPRSLSLDVHFQELLAWINDRSDSPDFRTLAILECQDYGWVEFVSSQTCNTSTEIERFYQRQGGYLALLYALEASDFHFDNLIAAGEHPVLVDLEGLFHPHLPTPMDQEADQIASDGLNYSVLKIGLLPQRLWSNDEYEGIDLSGLGTGTSQLSPDRIPYWQGAKTDEMLLARSRMEIVADQHQVTLKGNQVNVLDYQEFIMAGFKSIYQLLMQHKDFLLSSQSILQNFANDETRVLVRSSRTYALLLQEGFHPNVLRNALDRDRLFDSLWAEVHHFPYLARLITAELEELQNGDIPKFTTRPSSHDVWSTSAHQVTQLFPEPALVTVQRRIEELSDRDLRQQLWYIKASLSTVVGKQDRQRWASYTIGEPTKLANSTELLEQAKKVANHLETLALKGEHDAAWLGLKFHNESHSSIVQLSYDLYDGIPGLCLFFAYLGEVTQEQRYTQLAQASVVNLKRHLEKQKENIKNIGSFSGWGGIIYTFTHLSQLWQDRDLLAEAEAIVHLLPDLIEQDEEFDILGGAAGCILALITLYKSNQSASVLNTAILCGDRLLAQAQQMEEGIGWLVKNSGDKPLAGFSHGSAGIASALLELASLTGETRFQQAALDAIAYERTLFCAEANNWFDLRLFSEQILTKEDKTHLCNSNWCHGAPGIGLARLRSLAYLDDAQVRSEIDTAVQTTMQEGFGNNHSLCHGDLGNIELLLQAGLHLNDSYWQQQVTRFSSIIVSSIEQKGWLCGVPLAVETPGLMTGLAGIGYQLMRLAQPNLVPSVLLLEAPKI